MALRDHAVELRRRGNEVTVYAPVLTTAWRAEFARAGITATDDPATVSPRPHLIHGQHGVAFLACMHAFPECAVVQWLHDLEDPVDIALRHPAIAVHVAVDSARAGRALGAGVDPANVRIIANAVDLAKFAPVPLPEARRALAILKRDGLEHTEKVVRDACTQTGWNVSFAGNGVRREVNQLEQAYAACDLVIASGRCALEAIAMGRSVILCDHNRLGGLVGDDNWNGLREHNLGRNAMNEPLTQDRLSALLVEATKVDPVAFSARVRPSLDLRLAGDQVESLYRDVLRTHAPLEPLDMRATWSADLLALATELSKTHLEHWHRIAKDMDARR